MTLNTSQIHGGLPQVARAEEEKAFYCLYPIKCATRCQGDWVIVGKLLKEWWRMIVLRSYWTSRYKLTNR